MKSQKIILLITLSFMLFVLSTPLVSQEGRGKGRLAGWVKDEEGKALKDVKITIFQVSKVSSGGSKELDGISTTGKKDLKVSYNFKLETKSDKKGKWGIFGFASGNFEFKAEKKGYTTLNKIIKLSQMVRNPFMKLVLSKETEKKESKATNTKNKAMAMLVKKGNKLVKEKKYAEALPIFVDFVSKYPDNYKVAINLGNCYMELKDYKGAIKAFEIVIKGFKKDIPDLKGNKEVSVIYANMGEAHTGLKDYDKAAKAYKKSMDISPPTDAAVAYNVAEIMFVGGKTDEAIAYYTLAAKLKPEMAIYYSKLGYAYLNKGDIKKAILNFEKFIKMTPKDPQVPTLKAMIKDLKG